MGIIIPVCVLVVLLLVYWNTGSVIKLGMVMLALPFSLIGAVWLMWSIGFSVECGFLGGANCTGRLGC